MVEKLRSGKEWPQILSGSRYRFDRENLHQLTGALAEASELFAYSGGVGLFIDEAVGVYRDKRYLSLMMTRPGLENLQVSKTAAFEKSRREMIREWYVRMYQAAADSRWELYGLVYYETLLGLDIVPEMSGSVLGIMEPMRHNPHVKKALGDLEAAARKANEMAQYTDPYSAEFVRMGMAQVFMPAYWTAMAGLNRGRWWIRRGLPHLEQFVSGFD